MIKLRTKLTNKLFCEGQFGNNHTTYSSGSLPHTCANRWHMTMVDGQCLSKYTVSGQRFTISGIITYSCKAALI